MLPALVARGRLRDASLFLGGDASLHLEPISGSQFWGRKLAPETGRQNREPTIGSRFCRPVFGVVFRPGFWYPQLSPVRLLAGRIAPVGFLVSRGCPRGRLESCPTSGSTMQVSLPQLLIGLGRLIVLAPQALCRAEGRQQMFRHGVATGAPTPSGSRCFRCLVTFLGPWTPGCRALGAFSSQVPMDSPFAAPVCL